MPVIDPMRVDQCVAHVKFDDDEDDRCGSIDVEVKLEEEGGESNCFKKEEEESNRLKKPRRGRPPRTEGKGDSSPKSRKRRREEEEDVCFVCFDGGSLVLCDRRGCPKAYHPACVKRTEAFFRSRSKWNCGWHICTACQKDSFYMCYTCPYSVCKRCVRSSQYVLVRENKGFCGICVSTILLIENAPDASKEKVQVDFDDQGSWEYLFKIYWVSLKEKLSLTLDDLTKAKNPWKSKRRTTTSRLHEKDDGNSKARKMEAMSFPVDGASRSCERLNTSEQHQEGASEQLNEQHSVQLQGRPSSSDSRNHEAPLSNKAMDDLDMNMIWLYGDPDGKIHGPFSLLNLRQWNASGYFPPELRIWRLGEQQSSSILLTDALSGQVSIPNPSISEKQEETVTIANEQNRSVAVTKLESGVLDFSSNSVCTDQSVITSSNSVITKSSDAYNRGGTAWDSNSSGLVSSFTDNQEIDFLDLFSSTFKFNFASNDTTTDCWQPIVTGPDECDESVSDLLAEVEAMESQNRLPSPTSTFRDCSPVEGHSPSLDASKGDSMSSTNAFKN